MDVHARTITVKGIDGSTAATAAKRFDDVPAPSEIASWMQGEFTGPWYAAHESGCTGFHLCGEPRALGVDCDMVVVASIARSDSDRKRKNNRRDAWAGRKSAALPPIRPSVKEWCALNKVAESSLHEWMVRFREGIPIAIGPIIARAHPCVSKRALECGMISAFLLNITLPLSF